MFLNSIWMCGQNNIRYNPNTCMVRWIGIVLMTQKVDKFRFVTIREGFLNLEKSNFFGN